jgi:protein SCO1
MGMRICADGKLCPCEPIDDFPMSNPVKAISLGLIATVAAVAGLVVASYVFEPDHGPDVEGGIQIASGTLLPSPRAIPEFTLARASTRPASPAGGA